MNNQIFAYIYDFLQIFFGNSREHIEQVILFGSATGTNLTEDSDIDLFIDVDENTDQVEMLFQKALLEFETSQGKKWALQGISYPIKAIIGKINSPEWQHLKPDLASNGIVLFDRYKILPKGLEHRVIISYDLSHIAAKDKVKFIRTLYGYSNKIKDKIYSHKGLLHKFKGLKINNGVISVPIEYAQQMYDFFKQENMVFSVSEVWVSNN